MFVTADGFLGLHIVGVDLLFTREEQGLLSWLPRVPATVIFVYYCFIVLNMAADRVLPCVAMVTPALGVTMVKPIVSYYILVLR